MIKAKKKSVVVLALSVLLLGAAAALVLLTLLRPGASSPELAVQHYEEACMLYDADGMVRYSSDYNRYVLYRSRTPESAGELKRYLKDIYAQQQAQQGAQPGADAGQQSQSNAGDQQGGGDGQPEDVEFEEVK